MLKEVIETERLRLRPFRLNDVEDVFSYPSDPEWARFLPVPQPYTKADAERFIASQLLLDRERNPSWAIELDGIAIGGIDIEFDFNNQVAEMGYSIARAYWGRGFVTEVARAVINAAFSAHPKLNRIRAMVDVRNAGSLRVMEKLGMVREGILRQNRLVRGEFTDDVWCGVLRAEWEAQMSPSSDQRVAEFYAQTYDESVPDWPGEIEFYRELASKVRRNGEVLLELGCGTGRVAIRLAQEGTQVVGFDLSVKMIKVATEKSKGMSNVCWVQADMRSFELGETFGLVIIPGHAFQNLNTPQDQVACLSCIKRHLKPGGLLVVHLDHQDFNWLASLLGEKGGLFEVAEQFQHARTGHQIRTSRAWSYEPATQTAICVTRWEAIGSNGEVVDRWETKPVRLHCVFRFEMEHLLARAGFSVEAVYGDFFRHPLEDKSSEMIWIAQKPGLAI